MTAKLDPMMEALARSDALDPPAEFVASIGRGAPRDLARRAQELIGHPVHPMLTDLPIGFWTSAWFLDLLPGRKGAAPAARRLLGLGVLSTLPTVVSGLGDAADLKRRESRMAAAHAGLNVAATAAFAMSWWMRRRETTARARMVAHVGAALATGAAAIGGRLAFPPADAQSSDSSTSDTSKV
jgi:uncharacterized membrane protein